METIHRKRLKSTESVNSGTTSNGLMYMQLVSKRKELEEGTEIIFE